jgi:hypothetical protein
MQTGNRTVNWPLYIEATSDNAICRKYGQEEESSYHTLCQVQRWLGNRMKIFGSAWVEPIDISRASIRKGLAVALRTGALFKGHSKNRRPTMDPVVV